MPIQSSEFNSATDASGNVYIADGQIYVFDKTGKKTGTIEVPERPVTICFGGKDNKTLFVTTNTSLYSVRMP